MWDVYAVRMLFEGRLCGSVPLSKELIKPWLESRKPNIKPDDARPIEEIEEEVLASIQEAEERTTLGFQQDKDGFLYVRAGTLKSHLKDCANQTKDVLKVKALKSKVANRMFIEPEHVYIRSANGERMRTITDEFEQPVHVWTPQGQRNALKKIQYIERPLLMFDVRLLKNKEVTLDVLDAILQYGGVHGYGGERGMGEGRYQFKIESVVEERVG